MVDSSQCLFYLFFRLSSPEHPDVMVTVTWCVGSVSAMMAGEISIIKYSNYMENTIFTWVLVLIKW